MSTGPVVELATDASESINPQLFRDSMARIGAAVTVVTSDGVEGRVGFTATAVCSVTDTPATLLVCLNQSASAYKQVIGNGVLCVNVLGADHDSLAMAFGGKTPMHERFAGAQWHAMNNGTPALEEAPVNLSCRIKYRVPEGTHDILICSVEQIRIHEQARTGLHYYARRFHVLANDD